ncbi:MAG TPA: acyl-CoA dehydrogenase family protein [Methylomirabilota bacterium]|nr:acyl-CoA dehydrogenase family protein [Methylomirabilota bacterium]
MPDASSARAALDDWRATRARNAFDDDPFFRELLDRHVADTERPELEAELRALAGRLDADFDDRVARCNRDEHLPRVERHDPDGRPLERVAFHPDHHEVGRVFWGSRALAVLGEPGHEVEAGARIYLLDQFGEAGHACPVACTAGAIRLIRDLGSDEQRRRFLPGLLEPDYDRRLHAAQFVTEVQGGSDVGLNEVRAVRDDDAPGGWRLSGEKWFCSVADAGLFVVSARPEGAPEGTRGLGLFLVPREIDGRPNNFQLRRLKVKLGTRSMPTGEIELDGAAAEPIGGLGDGFRHLVGIVLDTSRVHNALAACGLMRRALVDARAFAAVRVAFDHPIADFPAIQAILARMRVRTEAALAASFRVLAQTDRLDTGAGDDTLRAARRISVMVTKYWTAIHATRVARDGIEVLGGNGTIEDFSIMPRLYRDAIVIESWEGTHNTLCAQVLRDFAVRRLHEPWLAELEREAAALTHPNLAGTAATARGLLDALRDRLERLLAADQQTATAWIRDVVDRMAAATDWIALAGQAQWDLEHGGPGLADSLELYRRLELEPRDRLDDPERIALERRLA